MTHNLSSSDIHKLPRLYLDAPFALGSDVSLQDGQSHYLHNVLRRQEGEFLRVFNGRDGEWLARITKLGKKGGFVAPEERLRAQDEAGTGREIHLYFSPIKKQRMDMLIEKAVELGVNALHPVLMHRSVMRTINEERVMAQMIEAAEQCERMDIPALCPMETLDEVLYGLTNSGAYSGVAQPLYACIERRNETTALGACVLSENAAFLIGPEGGFDDDEIAALLTHEKVKPVCLGETILRAETASLACLSYARFSSF